MKNNIDSAVWQCVYKTVEQIPTGKVLTYTAIAKVCAIRTPRYVGYILHRNPKPETIPCHRVVRSDGTIAEGYAFGGREAQIKRLVAEGIELTHGRIDLNVYAWPISEKVHH